MVIVLGILVLVDIGCASNDHQRKSYLIRHASVTLAQASELAEKNGPGRAVNGELVFAGGHVVYKVEIIDAINQERTIWIDAETGKLVKGP
jgi:uncharacterized membrane protein YkoI